MKKSALIILEKPWGAHISKNNQASVLPFFKGLESIDGSFDTYYSNFYETKSFEQALDALTESNYKQYYIYVACHGEGLRLDGLNLETVMRLIDQKAQEKNIVGVLYGSCLVGNNIGHFEAYTQASSICWKIGYKCSVNWLDGTLLDVNLLSNLIGLTDKRLHQEDYILNSIKSALSTYKSDCSIGSNEQEEEMLLSDSLATIIQPKGQGKKPKDVSDLLFEE
ncbi:MAG: hypothetical protein V7736_09220 [Colwellia polaris]|jgi:hypothetical protein